mgnify:FL=1
MQANIYNFYHASMPQVASTKFDAHRKSELRTLYQNMVRLNQKKPFYKLTLNNATQNYVIGIKEAALELKTSAAFLDEDTAPESRKMTVYTDNASILSAHLLTDDYHSLPSEIELQVQQLAGTQINKGAALAAQQSDIPAGKHQLLIQTAGSDYQFEIDTKPGESNLRIQRRLAMSINNSNIGIRARVTEDGTTSVLSLESHASGEGTLEGGLRFRIQDLEGSHLAKQLGIQQVSQTPQDAVFQLNGESQHSSSNQISINNGIGIELHQTSNEPATIRLTPDTTSILEDVDNFVDVYNHFIDLANQTEQQPNGSKKLLNELKGIGRYFYSTLESSGLTITADGHLKKDDALLVQSTKNGQFQELFQQLSDFKRAIQNTTNKITLNPMEYVDKMIVSYPNTRQTFPNPYLPSIYSGMLFNQYV